MPISQRHGARLRASLQISDPHEAASVHLLILLKNKTNPKKQNQPLYINNKNLVTKIIKSNPGQSLLPETPNYSIIIIGVKTILK